MDASRLYAQLQEACSQLDAAEEHAAAAHVAHAMTLLQHRYDLDEDRSSDER